MRAELVAAPRQYEALPESLKKVSCGTELNILQEGIPDVIPPEACCLGWQESLTLLVKLVEAEIPD